MNKSSIKQNFDIIAILNYYGLISDISTCDIDIKVNCPFHEESVPSCNISLASGIYYCFGCGKSGNLIDLISQIEKVNKLKAIMIATKISKGTSDVSNRFISEKPIIDKVELSERAKLFFDGLPIPSWDIIKNHYLLTRGFRSSILKKFDVRINQSSSYPVIIPLYEEEVFKGYILRRIDNDEPKYLFSRGFEKHHTIVGNLFMTPILVVEGVLDMMKAVQYGFKNVCTILGWSASDYQLDKLSKTSRVIVSALDNDEAGNRGYGILKNYFGNKLIKFSYPGKKKDICELSQEEFRQSMEKCQEV